MSLDNFSKASSGFGKCLSNCDKNLLYLNEKLLFSPKCNQNSLFSPENLAFPHWEYRNLFLISMTIACYIKSEYHPLTTPKKL
jgi:hypothetical protein